MPTWNPWHECHKLSSGCQNCYVYRIDQKHNRDSSVVVKNQDFNLPIKRNKKGEYKIPEGETVYTCFSSDFFVEEADEWRKEAWNIIKQRMDLDFLIITKRIDRFWISLPDDWENGYENVSIYVTCENQDRADYRLPIFQKLPIKHKGIICEPLLEKINLGPYLGEWVEEIICGGESGKEARVCKFEWVQEIRQQCMENNITFTFKQTGAKFIKDGKLYNIKREFQHKNAKKAGLDFTGRVDINKKIKVEEKEKQISIW